MMTKTDIQTVLDALWLAADYANCAGDMDAAIATLQAALARVDKPLEPSEPYAWEYTNVHSGFKQLQSYPPKHFLEWNDMEMWHATPLFTHPGSKPEQIEPVVTDEMIAAYLVANNDYWNRTDELPKHPAKWRTGTPSEATRVSLEAALKVAHPASKPEPLPKLRDDEIVMLYAEQPQCDADMVEFARAIEQAVWGKCRG